MKYYKDIDYFLYFLDFPHMGVPGAIAANRDGTVNIYINTLYNPDRQAEALRHELRHLIYQHCWDDKTDIGEKERLASLERGGVVFAEDFSWVQWTEPERIPNVFLHPDGLIPVFFSLEKFRDYMFSFSTKISKKRNV